MSDCMGGEVAEPVDRVSLLWPTLAGGPFLTGFGLLR